MVLRLATPPMLPDGLTSAKLAEAGAQGVSAKLQEHFRALAQKPNKKGFPRSWYWQDAAESVSVESAGAKAVVTVAKEGVALHYHGGTVRSKSGKALAIPCAAAAYGVWPSHAPGELDFIPAKGRGDAKGYLVKPDTGEIMWALYSQTTHTADPSVLPTEAELMSAAEKYMMEGLSA